MMGAEGVEAVDTMPQSLEPAPPHGKPSFRNVHDRPAHFTSRGQTQSPSMPALSP